MELTDAAGTPLASGRTDDDGRIKSLGATLAAGIYRLRFDTGEYFAASGTAGFYPEVVIAFDLADVDAQYHVPLLLSPYAYSTYRGELMDLNSVEIVNTPAAATNSGRWSPPTPFSPAGPGCSPNRTHTSAAWSTEPAWAGSR